MNKLSKILLAGALTLGVGSAIIAGQAISKNNIQTAEALSWGQLESVSIDGSFITDLHNDTDSTHYGYDSLCWAYYGAGSIEFFNYHGGPININFQGTQPVDYFLTFNGENEIINDSGYQAGIVFAGDYCQKNISIIFNDGASLKIKSQTKGIAVNPQKNRTVDSQLSFDNRLNRNTVIIESGGNGIQADKIIFNGTVDYFVKSNEVGIASLVDSATQQLKITANQYATVTAIGGTKAINGLGSGSVSLFTPTNAVLFNSSDYKAVNLAPSSKTMEGFLQFADSLGSARLSLDDSEVSCALNETKELAFNNVAIPSFDGYTISRTVSVRNATKSETLYQESNSLTTPITYSFTPNDTDTYSTNFSLRLSKNGTVAAKTEYISYLPYGYHTISESVNGLSVVPENGSDFTVRTGNDFEFYTELDDYYDENPSMILATEQGDVTHVSGNHYKIENVKNDLDIFTTSGPKYYSNVKVYVEDTVIASAKVGKGQTYTLPTLTADQIPAGKTFDYWKVGNKANHYLQGGSVSFNESERGEIRIEAHFTGLYNLTITDGHFYSDAACTQVITQAAAVSVGSGHYTYFKFDSPIGEVVNDKMLYWYQRTSETNVDIWEGNNDVFMFEMVAGDVTIEPIYKLVVQELTAKNVVIPVSGEALIERSIKAPADACYAVNEFGNACYKIVGGNKTSVYTYDLGNPYHFENGATYEFSFDFRIKTGENYVFHPDGYLRNGGCQINIDGLESSDYNLISADFTNSSKENFKVVLQIEVVNRYSVSVTNGSASINNENVTLAADGASVLLVANAAPTGQAFDKWEVSGITLSETELNSSRLLIEMPNNDVAAVATYKSVPYFTISFNANGGTGTMSDDISYGTYTLPECTFTAPAHMYFVYWLVNEEECDPFETIVIEENTEIKAVWAYGTCAVMFAHSEGATGSMPPANVMYGENYTLPTPTFTPNEGYEFKYWTLDGVKIETPTVHVTDDITLTAVYGEVVVLDHITIGGTQPTEFIVGDTFSSDGLVVTAYYSDDTSHFVTDYVVSGYDMNTAGEQTVTVSYTEGGITKTATYTITVNERHVEPPVDPEEPTNNKGLPTPVLIAIIAGSVVLVAVAIVLIVKFAGKKK